MFEIKQLDRNTYENYSFKVEYTTDKYYDVVLLDNGFQLLLKYLPIPMYKSFTDTLFSSWLEEPIAFGIFKDDTLLAFIEGSPEKWHNLFRISNINVCPSFRKHGLGEALLNYMIEYVRSLETYRGIILETQTCNYAAISLYKKAGFKLNRIDLHEYSNEDIENKEVRIDLFLPV